MHTRIRVVVSAISISIAAILILSVNAGVPARVTICEVARQPDRFDGKVVQIRGNVVAVMNSASLSDSTCSASILLDEGAMLPPEFQGQFAFVRSLGDLKQPDLLTWRRIETSHPVSWSGDQGYRTLVGFLGKKLRIGEARRICDQCPLSEVTATLTGRIDHLATRLVGVRLHRGAAMRTYGVGFGVKADLTRLAPHSISDVVAKPIDPSVYEKNR